MQRIVEVPQPPLLLFMEIILYDFLQSIMQYLAAIHTNDIWKIEHL